MNMVRDRAMLGQAVLLAILAQSLYLFCTQSFLSGGLLASLGPGPVLSSIYQSVFSLLFTMLAFTPATLIVGNLFERRTEAFQSVKQDYPALATTILYAIAASYFAALPLAYLIHITGLDAVWLQASLQGAEIWKPHLPPELQAELANPRRHLESLFTTIHFPLYAFWVVAAVREVFRFSWLRSIAATILGSILMLPIAFFLAAVMALLGPIFSSPLILILLYYLLGGYFKEVANNQRARISFRRNLEASTLNPADASAHYNLGLLHLQRKEFDEARQRFEKAVSIDADEVDAYYQLGRIARMQGRYADAISHFSEVVTRDDRHAQNELWREIGATYLAAGQYSDAIDALEKFLERRQTDPEGLYLAGRAQAALGNYSEAAAAMRACIDAVRNAPAYKYRAEKRWMSEAESFLASRQ
jgi:tetratricopeptide (TPR) repeat protein